ncbi:hypothetical protein CEXT_403711 [Caerostris extrusa]|uniref:Uncharacterized protein n=1 Tax=Caerostris extrusa TaxID=172846 RepID=A0AAV4Q3L0_CAEEX|nr:hypothetical protein CEXT_403711 [Caerostris extrusa]
MLPINHRTDLTEIEPTPFFCPPNILFLIPKRLSNPPPPPTIHSYLRKFVGRGGRSMEVLCVVEFVIDIYLPRPLPDRESRGLVVKFPRGGTSRGRKEVMVEFVMKMSRGQRSSDKFQKNFKYPGFP